MLYARPSTSYSLVFFFFFLFNFTFSTSSFFHFVSPVRVHPFEFCFLLLFRWFVRRFADLFGACVRQNHASKVITISVCFVCVFLSRIFLPPAVAAAAANAIGGHVASIPPHGNGPSHIASETQKRGRKHVRMRRTNGEEENIINLPAIDDTHTLAHASQCEVMRPTKTAN